MGEWNAGGTSDAGSGNRHRRGRGWRRRGRPGPPRWRAPPPSASGQTAATPRGPVAVPEPSEKALRYYRSGNVIWAFEQTLGFVLPALLLFTGLSARIRTFAAGVAHDRFYPTLVVYFAVLSVLLFVVQLPVSYYTEFVREHAYGLSTQKLGKWIGDELKGMALGILLGALVLWVPYLLLAHSPTRWWLWTGALSLPFFTLILLITPVFISPLFNKFGPMKDKAMEGEVLATAARAGVEGARVFEVDKSVDTEKVNAYVTGVGQTKRIVLWDTLLKRLNARQIKFVVGHELGHYVLGHVWTSILISSALTLLGLLGVHKTADLRHPLGGTFGFDKISDVASMPLLMLLLSLFAFVTPAALAPAPPRARGRSVKARADPRQPRRGDVKFVSLQQQILAVPRPCWLYKFIRASHPPIGERGVDFINGYRPWATGIARALRRSLRRWRAPARTALSLLLGAASAGIKQNTSNTTGTAGNLLRSRRARSGVADPTGRVDGASPVDVPFVGDRPPALGLVGGVGVRSAGRWNRRRPSRPRPTRARSWGRAVGDLDLHQHGRRGGRTWPERIFFVVANHALVARYVLEAARAQVFQECRRDPKVAQDAIPVAGGLSLVDLGGQADDRSAAELGLVRGSPDVVADGQRDERLLIAGQLGVRFAWLPGWKSARRTPR